MTYSNQHVISKVLLQRFAEGFRVGTLDLDTHQYDQKSPEVLGAIQNLVPVDAKKFEDKWERVERKLDHAFNLIDSRQILKDEKFCDALRDCIALHYARSRAVKAMFDASLNPKREQVVQRMLARFPAQQVVHELTGIFVPPASAAVLAPELLHEHTSKRIVDGNWMGETLLDLFKQGREKTKGRPIEIWYADTADFLIGDVPVVTYNRSDDKVGMKEGVAWSDAEAVFLPLGPKHVVALARQSGYHEANENMVLQLNVLQIRNAMQHVFFRPSSGLDVVLRRELRKPA